MVGRKIKLPNFSSSPSRDLIGPPCPLSNLRPVYYAPLFPTTNSNNNLNSNSKFHPYSLSEFPISSSSSSSNASSKNKKLEMKLKKLEQLKQKLNSEDLEWRLTRYRFDSFNQSFWSKTNTKFLLARENYIASLPLTSSSSASINPLANSTEIDLSPFYANHLAVTKNEYAVYNKQLLNLQLGLLWPAIKSVKRELKWKFELWKIGGQSVLDSLSSTDKSIKT